MQTCFECGHDSLQEAEVEMMGERNSETFLVRTNGYRCGNCGFQTIDSEQSEHFTRKLSDAYRVAHGLLTSRQIRERRMELGMTQNEFATYLGPGVASVRRWELGQIQEKAMDILIRLKTDPAEARQNLRTVTAQFEEKCVVSTFGALELQLTYLHRHQEEADECSIQMDAIDFQGFDYEQQMHAVAA